MAFARSLEFPDLGEVLDRCELLSPVAGYRIPASMWRRYDRLPALPARLLVVGDALASFNPIYGQGMTVAALEALAVRAQLERGGLRSHAPHDRPHLKQVAPAWKMSASADLAFPGVPGTVGPTSDRELLHLTRPGRGGIRPGGCGRVPASGRDGVDRPEQLLKPAMAGRVLRHRQGTTRVRKGAKGLMPA